MVNGSGKENKSSVTREEQEEGVRINLISSRKLDSMSSQDKLRFILDPDRITRPELADLKKEIDEVDERLEHAYKVLSDHVKRAQYNQSKGFKRLFK